MKIDKTLIIVSAILKNKEDKILLLKRGETRTFQAHWQLPEGKLEEKENPQEALGREIKEELGLDVNSVKLNGVSKSILQAKGVKYLTLRIIFLVKVKNKRIILSPEHSGYKWVKPNEIARFELLPGTAEVIKSIN